VRTHRRCGIDALAILPLSKEFDMRFFAGFIAGLVIGYCIVLFGWVALTNVVAVRDFEGAAAMQVAFFFAPLGGIVMGVAVGLWFQLRKRAGS
jgi:hypothetical protein